VEIFLNRLHRFNMLDRRFMRPTPGYLAHIPPIYIILVAVAHCIAVKSIVSMPLCYRIHVLCGGGCENHHRYCGGQTSIVADYGEPPIEPLNSAFKSGLVTIVLVWNTDI
jgi:hypothetical protein